MRKEGISLSYMRPRPRPRVKEKGKNRYSRYSTAIKATAGAGLREYLGCFSGGTHRYSEVLTRDRDEVEGIRPAH